MVKPLVIWPVSIDDAFNRPQESLFAWFLRAQTNERTQEASNNPPTQKSISFESPAHGLLKGFCPVNMGRKKSKPPSNVNAALAATRCIQSFL